MTGRSLALIVLASVVTLAAQSTPFGEDTWHHVVYENPAMRLLSVNVAPGTARGSHDVTGTVTYFYCSKREGWCRKGTTDVAFPIAVP